LVAVQHSVDDRTADGRRMRRTEEARVDGIVEIEEAATTTIETV
jgi:hypothetical protein